MIRLHLDSCVHDGHQPHGGQVNYHRQRAELMQIWANAIGNLQPPMNLNTHQAQPYTPGRVEAEVCPSDDHNPMKGENYGHGGPLHAAGSDEEELENLIHSGHEN